MKPIKKSKLTLDTQTIRVLDPDQMSQVNGGAGGFISNWMPCVSNNGGGRSCLGYCPGAAQGGGGQPGGGGGAPEGGAA